MTHQLDTSYLCFRGVTKCLTQACTIPGRSLHHRFPPKDPQMFRSSPATHRDGLRGVWADALTLDWEVSNMVQRPTVWASGVREVDYALSASGSNKNQRKCVFVGS